MSDLRQFTSAEEFEQFMTEQGKVAILDRPLSSSELSAMEEARKLGADGISNSPVTLWSIFNYINSVRFGGYGIFARLETASETSKYETGSEILGLYATEHIFNPSEQVVGRRLAEIQIDCGDYRCTDAQEPYRPQLAYYSYGFSKISVLSWNQIEDLSKMTTADFVTELLLRLRNCLSKDMGQLFKTMVYSYDSLEKPVSKSMARNLFKQITASLEKTLNRM